MNGCGHKSRVFVHARFRSEFDSLDGRQETTQAGRQSNAIQTHTHSHLVQI